MHFFFFSCEQKKKKRTQRKRKNADFLRPSGVQTKWMLRASPHSLASQTRAKQQAYKYLAKLIYIYPSNSARHCSVRASNEVTSEHKRFGEAEQKKETAEQSEDVESQRDFFFLSYFLFSLPRK